ncbi:hypothetical protein PR202_ga05751 [Eleusine coracana subsp. coracana]|uniref:Uncharacterized protein n=1 Tax=Eleusine coracana subsp. coracana TaxID=191504 RepID=A0AAV5BVQ1_ELECO|nr:hypothetical protein QOZ80_5AG0365630 [Eleusine coracana subsp. coracana]GJM89547.1 hypothetical protein PR202_ga05751 [Eleusine coracana subsp. coracana]
MAEELDEFEVLWPEACLAHAAHGDTAAAEVQSPPEASMPRAVQCFGLIVPSRPVDVPTRPARSCRWIDDGGEDEEDDGGRAIVPPHLLLSGRRRSEAWTARMPCNCKRAGDLRQLRDSVLRMTGFIEG